MRVFSGDSSDIPEIKYWLYKHKEFMEASGIDSYKSVRTLPGGRVLSITSLDGIDNIVIGKVGEKRKLEEFELPKELKDQVLIWLGATDINRFPIETYKNLSLFWGSQIELSSFFPFDLFDYSMIFIPSPSRNLTDLEYSRLINWKNKTGGKIIIHLGVNSLPRIIEPLNQSSEDMNIMNCANDILEKLESPLRAQIMWSALSDYLSAGPSEVNNYYDSIITNYYGVSTDLNFNNLSGGLLANGGTFSVKIDEIAGTSLLGAYVATDPIGSINIPLLYGGVSSMLPRYGFAFPSEVSIDPGDPDWMKWGYQLSDGVWWTLDGSLFAEYLGDKRSFERLLSYQDDPDYGWWVEPVLAHYNNIMLSCMGNSWFSDPLVLNPVLLNAKFILTLLIEKWKDPSKLFKATIPFLSYWSEGGISILWPIQM